MQGALLAALAVASTAHRLGTGLARCGPFNRFKCPESDPCCSKWGYCGTVEHCAPGICLAGCPSPPKEHAVGPASAHLAAEMRIGDNSIVPYELIPKLGTSNVQCGCKKPSHAALTFDDGINPKYTPLILDVLAMKNAPATFFLLGNSVHEWKDMNHTVVNKDRVENTEHLKRMCALGHEIGMHSFDHTAMPLLSDDDVIRQANDTQAVIADVIGTVPRMFRAPEGKLSPRVLVLLLNLNYTVVHWTHDTLDWLYYKTRPQHMLRYIRSALPDASKAQQGPVILQHDNNAATVECQAQIIDAIRAKNYTLVSLSVCLGEDAYMSESGTSPDELHKFKPNGQVEHVRPCTFWDNLAMRLCAVLDAQRPICNRNCA